jgi:hypothetical protein
MAAHAITYQLESKCKAGGSGITPVCAKIPSVATVAYTFSPAAKLVAVRTAKSSLEEILTAADILSQLVTLLTAFFMRSHSRRNFAADLVEEIEDEADFAHRKSLS